MKSPYRDPSVQAIRSERNRGPRDLAHLAKAQATDMLQRPTKQTDAESKLPRIFATLGEVDSTAATVTFTFDPSIVNDPGWVDLKASKERFLGFPLSFPGGPLCGQIATVNLGKDGTLECVADLTNTQVIADLEAGVYAFVLAFGQLSSQRSMAGEAVSTMQPISMFFVEWDCDLNPPYPVSKRFSIRRDDGRIEKRAFVPKPSMGTGVDSNIGRQLDAFKKIHAAGGEILDSDRLMKLSVAGDKPATQSRADATTQVLRKAHKSGSRRWRP